MDLFQSETKPIGKYRYLYLQKKQRLIDLEQNYFAQFVGEKLRWYTCTNCRAKFLAEEGPRDALGHRICCAHCIWNPTGCRCKYGEFNQPETDWWD